MSECAQKRGRASCQHQGVPTSHQARLSGSEEAPIGSRVRVHSPVGDLVIAGDDTAVRELLLPICARGVRASTLITDCSAPVREAVHQLNEYFSGKRRAFNLAIAPAGTEFQRQVWLALAQIPYGEVISYAELARAVGRPHAFRAVGQANGANPIPIIVPCHRVIAANGTIGGYGGGLRTKRELLALEGVDEESGLWSR